MEYPELEATHTDHLVQLLESLHIESPNIQTLHLTHLALQTLHLFSPPLDGFMFLCCSA